MATVHFLRLASSFGNLLIVHKEGVIYLTILHKRQLLPSSNVIDIMMSYDFANKLLFIMLHGSVLYNITAFHSDLI